MALLKEKGVARFRERLFCLRAALVWTRAKRGIIAFFFCVGWNSTAPHVVVILTACHGDHDAVCDVCRLFYLQYLIRENHASSFQFAVMGHIVMLCPVPVGTLKTDIICVF